LLEKTPSCNFARYSVPEGTLIYILALKKLLINHLVAAFAYENNFWSKTVLDTNLETLLPTFLCDENAPTVKTSRRVSTLWWDSCQAIFGRHLVPPQGDFPVVV
jgi:hypothetical protein